MSGCDVGLSIRLISQTVNRETTVELFISNELPVPAYSMAV